MITYSGSPMFGRASSKLKKDDQVQIHSEKSHWWEHIRVGRSCDIAEGEKIEEEKHNQMSVFDFGAINWNSNVRTWMKQSTHRHKQSKGWSMINCQKKKRGSSHCWVSGMYKGYICSPGGGVTAPPLAVFATSAEEAPMIHVRLAEIFQIKLET